MARRKVTMLEAFQRSARESAERAAEDRRRVIAEREKENRRAEAARAAQEFGHRLTQRAGGRVGSLLSGIRGAGEGSHVQVEAPSVAQCDPESSVIEASDAGVGAPTDIGQVSPGSSAGLGESSPPGRRGPALPGFDRASHGELAQVASGPTASPSGPVGSSSGAHSVEDGYQDDGRAEVEESFANATKEDVEYAIASLEDDVMELPMRPRVFALLSLVVLGAVFVVGYNVGSGDPVSADMGSPQGSARSMGKSAPLSGLALAAPRGVFRPGAVRAPLPLDQRPEPGALDYGPSVDSGAAGAAVIVAEEPPAVLPAQLSREDAAFQDPAMRFTIMAISYTQTEAHGRMALETYRSLYDEGFPVVSPIERKGRIFVFVGAAEKLDQLETLLAELRGLESGRGRAREFRSAFLVNTDPYR